MAEDKAVKKFKDKKIAVLGIGIEGISSAKYLVEKGAKVTLLDKKEEDRIDKEYLRKAKKLKSRLILGEKYLKDLDTYDVILRSPGIKMDIAEIKDVLRSGAKITSQTKIFFDLCPGKIIGVTGTKGKGTTSSLIYEMLKLQGYDAYIGGNIGLPPFEFLDKLNEQSIIVLELSSFQLQDIKKSPHVAVMLMVTSEHLDYHKDVFEYIDAKRNLLRFQNGDDFAILNKDYMPARESDVHTQATVYQISRNEEVKEGCYINEGKVMLRVKEDSSIFGLNPTYKTISIISTKDILLPGEHNLENACAASMAAFLSGVTKANIAQVLKTFKGLEHRLELVTEINGVKYYDDSFSTTPETAIAAIKAFENPEILILGGSTKKSDFKELGETILNAKNIKAIIGVGEEWLRIKFLIPNFAGKIIEDCKNMKQIVKATTEIAKEGDVVLLTPACASFDMFKNYKERGEMFKEEVGKLKN